jgi:tetratricopeptide (TPR) repeat protein
MNALPFRLFALTLGLAAALLASGALYAEESPCKDNYEEMQKQYANAMKLINQKKFKEAIPSLLCVQEYKEKKWGEGWALIGDCYAQLKDTKNALTAYKNAKKCGHTSASMAINMAAMASETGDTETARKTFEELDISKLGSDAEKASAYMARGLFYLRQKAYGNAAKDFEEANRLQKTADNAYYAGLSHQMNKDYEKALPLLQAAVKGNCTHKEDALQRLANLAIEKGRETNKANFYADAAGYAQQLFTLKPGEANYHQLLGEAQLGAQRFADAVKALEKAASLDPKDCFIKHNLGRAYRFNKQFDQAIATLQAAAKCSSSNHMVFMDLASSYEKKFEATGKKDAALLNAAIDACNQANKIKSGSATTALDRIKSLLHNLGVETEEGQLAQQQAAYEDMKKKLIPQIKFTEVRRDTATVGGKPVAMVFATAKNESATLQEVTVAVDFLDASGKVLATATKVIKGLAPKGSAAFSVEKEGMAVAAQVKVRVADTKFAFTGK